MQLDRHVARIPTESERRLERFQATASSWADCMQVHNGRGKSLIDLDAPAEAQKIHCTKVVQRSWYESNKHIFPANRWELFDELKHIAR